MTAIVAATIALVPGSAQAGDDTEGAAGAGTAPAAPLASEEPARPGPWATAAQYRAGSYRWMASRGALDFSLRFDTPGRVGAMADERFARSGPFVQTLPTLRLDLHDIGSPMRHGLGRSGYAELPVPERKVGIEWKPAESQLLFLRHGLGVRLSGDDRLTMRLRKGTIGLYMKTSF